MPALDGGNPGVEAVATFRDLLKQLLEEAGTAKATTTIEPALNKSDLHDLSGLVTSAVSRLGPNDQNKGRQFAILETAARDIFSRLIVRSTSFLHAARALTQVGDHCDRIPRLRQGVELPRHPLNSLR